MPTKKRKPDVCTRYAVRKGSKFYGIGNNLYGSFDDACLFRSRSAAVDYVGDSDVIVPVRCRALSAATKRSKKRTR